MCTSYCGARPAGYRLIIIAENSRKLDNIRSLLDDLVAKVVPLTQLGGEYIYPTSIIITKGETKLAKKKKSGSLSRRI